MEIKYLAKGSIFIKGKKENVWINPTKEEYSSKENEARIIIFTQKERDFVTLVEEGNHVVINGPGEYEIGGIEINGINSMYSLNIDGIKVVTVGKFEEEINDKKKEKLEEADVLLISMSTQAVDIAKKSAANYVIPVEYEGEEKELKIFMDAFDKENLESVESLKVDKESLPEGMEVVLLKTKI